MEPGVLVASGGPPVRGDPIFAKWYDAMQEAEALAEIDAVAKVREAGQGWQAHMTFLERRHSERWSRSERAGQGSRERQERPEDAFARLEEQEASKAASLRAVTG